MAFMRPRNGRAVTAFTAEPRGSAKLRRLLLRSSAAQQSCDGFYCGAEQCGLAVAVWRPRKLAHLPLAGVVYTRMALEFLIQLGPGHPGPNPWFTPGT